MEMAVVFISYNHFILLMLTLIHYHVPVEEEKRSMDVADAIVYKAELVNHARSFEK